MRKSVAILLLTTTCLLPSATFAFDGKREGLILGVGVGVANMSYTRTETNTTGIRTDSHFEGERMGFDADFKIGLGFNEDVMFLWYLGYSDFSDIESIRGGLFGMRVYRPFEMLFFALSFEMATLDDEGSTQSHDGWGLRGGVGWEFTKHWSVEAGVSWGRGHQDESYKRGSIFTPGNYDPEIKSKSIGVFVTLAFLAY